MKKNLLFTLAVLILAGLATLTSCQKKHQQKVVMLVDKITVPAGENIYFQKTTENGGGYLVVPADTTNDGVSDIKLKISTMPVIDRVCFLRIAYPEENIAFYNCFVEFDALKKEWTLKTLNAGDANVKLASK